MNNKEIASQFSLLSKLMELHGENEFKAKSYSVLAYKITRLSVSLDAIDDKEMMRLDGFNAQVVDKINELKSNGTLKLLNELILKTPEGILEMLKIKGIGPKKISVIWKDMGIENIGELLYACQENRLLLYKGFGKKTQENVTESIEFYLRQQGSFLFAQVEELAEDLEKFLQKKFESKQIRLTGDFLRHAETLDELEYVIPFSADVVLQQLKNLEEFELTETGDNFITYRYNDGIRVRLQLSTEKELVKNIFETTGSLEFVSEFENRFDINFDIAETEADIFEQAGIQFIPPFLRETKSIIQTASQNAIPGIIQPGDIRGIIHCHSNWSDGISTIEELATACIQSGKEYLVISDHSKTANYANGLTEERIQAQHKLIDELNKKLAPFKIFKSIESDILSDGSLDYSDSILSTFDLVITSVHSNLKMNEEKAMMRLINAIENPYTTILGHMTGRLLLSRRGYPVDYKKVIDACAANKVVIEINAHPRRLDMRWQWIECALSKNVLLSIDPDAHSIPEFDNTRYGVLVAQKGMVTPKQNLSSFSLPDFEKYIESVRK